MIGNTAPMASVILPVYNNDKYLAKAIQSVLDQTFRDFELIIIDDASEDQSFEIANSFTDERIILLRNEVNKKLPATLNRGIDIARGKYIIRMDADDISINIRFQHQIDFMEAHEDIGVCGLWMKIIDANDKPCDLGQCRYVDEEIKIGFLFGECSIPHPGVVIRRDILIKNNLKYNEDFFRAQDYELWSRCSQYTKFTSVKEYLLLYRKTDISVNYIKDGDSLYFSTLIVEKQLKNFGVSFNDEEMKIHSSIFSRININDKIKYLRSLEEWLKKLINYNETNRIFNCSVFNTFIVDKFARALITNNICDLKSIFFLLKSTLINYTDSRVKVIAKVIITTKFKKLVPIAKRFFEK